MIASSSPEADRGPWPSRAATARAKRQVGIGIDGVARTRGRRPPGSARGDLADPEPVRVPVQERHHVLAIGGLRRLPVSRRRARRMRHASAAMPSGQPSMPT